MAYPRKQSPRVKRGPLNNKTKAGLKPFVEISEREGGGIAHILAVIVILGVKQRTLRVHIARIAERRSRRLPHAG